MSEDILVRAKAVARKLDNGELHWQEYKAVVPELIAEVERLRSELTTANVRLMAAGEMVCAKDVRIQELSDKFDKYASAWAEIINKKADMIKELSEKTDKLDKLLHASDDICIGCGAKLMRIKELEAEVEAKDKQIKELQNIINKPPEEAQWMTDYHLLQSALDGPIIESARRWHGAFRKAQNSNLIRRQQNERLEAEVERLRAANPFDVDVSVAMRVFDDHFVYGSGESTKILQELCDGITSMKARIKELEEMIRQLGSLAFMGDMPLDQIVAHFIAWGQSNYDYTSRLEAAFLEQFVQGIQAPREMAELEAREALERIRNGE